MSDSSNINEPTDYEYFQKKRLDKTYLSKSIETTQLKRLETGEVTEVKCPIRIISKVFEGEEHHFIKAGQELVLRITPQQKQQVTAKFYEDTREVLTLQFQKYSNPKGIPHNLSFSFTGDEINKFIRFINSIELIPINSKEKQRFNDEYLQEISFTKDQFAKVVSQNPELLLEIIKNDINQKDIIALGYRKEQLKKFDLLLHNPDFFEAEKSKLNTTSDEKVWQSYLESNTWILGYGLNYVFNSPLEGKKLEQITTGFNVFGAGKRVDIFMKTRSILNSLCFGEIKTHKTQLLKIVKTSYRGECWAINDALSGAIAQIQKTVQKSIEAIKTKTQIKEENGNLTGEEVFLYQPKSFLIIGSLDQFKNEYGVNEDKFSSFELFRRNIYNPEIITFDELFERAKYIISNPVDENSL